MKLRGIEGIFSQTINSAAKFICDSPRCSHAPLNILDSGPTPCATPCIWQISHIRQYYIHIYARFFLSLSLTSEKRG